MVSAHGGFWSGWGVSLGSICQEGVGVCPGGVCLVVCVSLPGGVSAPVHAGIYTPPPPPWTEFLTHACENITIPQLRLQMVIILSKEFLQLC